MIAAHTLGPHSYLWKVVYPFHMPLFFLVAGYFYKEKEGVVLFKTSFERLIKPYIFVCIIISLIRIGQQILHSEPISINSHDILYGMGPVWFLLALFWCRIFFNYIIILFHTHYLIISFLASSFPLFFTYFSKADVPLAILQGMSCIIFMAFGFYYHKKDFSNLNRKHLIVIFISSTFFWVISAIYGKTDVSQCTFKLWFIDYLGALGGTYVCLFFSTYILNLKFLAYALTKISKFSVAILCFHTIDYVCFFWHHLYSYIREEDIITIIILGRIFILLFSIIITSKSLFLYHLFIKKTNKII